MIKSIATFETENKKRIVKRALVARASDKNGKCFHAYAEIEYKFGFADMFDNFFNKLNSFK